MGGPTPPGAENERGWMGLAKRPGAGVWLAGTLEPSGGVPSGTIISWPTFGSQKSSGTSLKKENLRYFGLRRNIFCDGVGKVSPALTV